MKIPDIRYARSGEVRIAYQVMGQGAFDLVFVPGFISNLEVHWEDPGFVHLLKRLSAFSRLILFDKRGTGLSDRVASDALPDLATRMDDVRAVMDASGSGRAVLLGASEGAPMSILFAATYPQRVRSLVLYGSYAHFHSAVMGEDELQRFIANAEKDWGTGASLGNFAPSRVGDPHFRTWWARFERLSVSPSAAVALARMNAGIDVRDVLARVTVPTLVIHRRDDARVAVEAGRAVARAIAGAHYVELAGRDHPIWTGDVDSVADVIETTLAGRLSRRARQHVLAALAVVRLPGGERAAGLPASHSERQKFERFHRQAQELIQRSGGEIAAAGMEQIAARFAAVRHAAEYALALREVSQDLRLKTCTGLHAGEIEIEGDKARGAALVQAVRLAEAARPDEILASSVFVEAGENRGLHFDAYRELPASEAGRALRAARMMPEQHLEPAQTLKAQTSLAVLSEREREVLELLAEGLSNGRIAARLGLSEHTVKRHVANILIKLDLPTRAAAAALVARAQAV
jgi:pimeloyl-ACP methyl ester carboxylesterase/DNA-binding NarL/FixJ family response regulator